MKEDKIMVYWIYNKLLWMLAGCILLLGVWIFTCFSIVMKDQTTRLTTFLFVIGFISFACYIWEKREACSREMQYGQ